MCLYQIKLRKQAPLKLFPTRHFPQRFMFMFGYGQTQSQEYDLCIFMFI